MKNLATNYSVETMAGMNRSLGYYGKLRKEYLLNSRKSTYTSLLVEGKLENYLREIDILANGVSYELEEMLRKERGVTKDLKYRDEDAYNEAVSNIKRQVEEVILTQIIYL